MKLNIAVSNNKILTPLYSNSKEVSEKFNLNFIQDDEARVRELLFNNRVDLALVSPVTFGKSILKGDLRIVPGPGLIAEGYTGIASIYFREGLKTINTAASPHSEDFLMLLGQKLLAERYNTYVKLEKKDGSAKDILKEYEAALVYEMSGMNDIALDITEEWFLYYETALPLAFWVTRAEEYPENVKEITKSLISKEIDDMKVEYYQLEEERSGRIVWEFNKNFEDAGDQLLEFLYFHQFFPENPSIKFIDEED